MTSVLGSHVEDYLRLRRALGYKLEREGPWLADLAAFTDTANAVTLTNEITIRWASQHVGAGPNGWAKRLGVARKFAAYLQTVIPTTQIPPTGVFPAQRHRRTPYLWSTSDIANLLETARTLSPPFRAASCETLLGLLATTGMRIGEAVGLGRDDVDLAGGVITIRHTKFDRTRLVPLHDSVTEALARYANERDRFHQHPRSTTFFVSVTGGPIDRSSIDKAVRQIATARGIRTSEVHPRVHDLRHSFAVRTIIGWQQSGISIDQRIAVLSTYLGHVAPADTYWYLSAAPELMASAADRLDTRYGTRP